MPRRRRPSRSSPSTAQIWRILRQIAREARDARREFDRRMAREAAARRKEAAEARREEAVARQEEAAARKKEAAEARREEAAARRKEAAARRKEAAARRKEAATREKEDAAQRRKLAALEDQYRKAEEQRRKELAQSRRELDQQLRKMAGFADNRWGQLIEALVEGNVVDVFRKAGVPVYRQFRRVRSRIEDTWREYDLVAVGDSVAVVVEVKTTLTPSDVRQFVERIGDFREWRPDHARPQILGALAYLTAEGESARTAEAAGFYLIHAASGSARLVNSEGFQPRDF